MKAQNDRQTDKRMASILSGIKRGGADCDRQFLDRLRAQSSAEFVSSAANVSRTRTNGAMPTWRVVAKSRIARIVAAAVIIVAVLMGITILSGRGERTGEVTVATKQGESESDSRLEVELRQVREMFAAGNVTGLATMLAEGEFESQLLAANYLVKMDNGAEALEVLEKVQADYGKDDPGNPFTPAVQRLKNRAGTASGQGSPPWAIGRGEPLVGRGLHRAPSAVTVADSEAAPAALERGAPPDMSEQPQDTTGQEPLQIIVEDARTGPELVEGIAGRAYYFDGVGDYIDCGSLGSFPSRGTIAFWMVADEIANYRNPFTTDFAGSNAGVRFEEDGNGRVVLVWDSDSDRVRGYIDGADKFDESQIGWPSTLPDVQIGRGYSASPSRHWIGAIDEVAIFNRPLSADEIQQLYQNPGSLRGNEAGLVGYWNFDSDNGAVVKDSSRYHNDGLLCGRDMLPELTEGASGYGYYFDGDGDYIEIPPIEGLGTEQTKMLWVYADGFMRSHSIYLIDEGGQQSNNNWIELLDSDGNGVPNIRAGFDGDNLFDSDGEIEAGYWYHIAVVSTSAGDVFTYINGVFDSSRTGCSTTTEPTGIVIGADGQTRSACFKGIIDEVAIFARGLSDDEIWQIYQNTGRLRGNEAGLVGYWNFDRDEGDTVRDMSRYGNHGALGGD
jgi:hypothetical protein